MQWLCSRCCTATALRLDLRPLWLTWARPRRWSGWEMADASCALQRVECCVCPPCGWAHVFRAASSCIACPRSGVSRLAPEFWHPRWPATEAPGLCSPAELGLSVGVTRDSRWRGWPAQAQQRCDRCLLGSLGTRAAVKSAFVK